ncbi:unnamed protein product, partial [Discosporangium mesarthrocarpum]
SSSSSSRGGGGAGAGAGASSLAGDRGGSPPQSPPSVRSLMELVVRGGCLPPPGYLNPTICLGENEEREGKLWPCRVCDMEETAEARRAAMGGGMATGAAMGAAMDGSGEAADGEEEGPGSVLVCFLCDRGHHRTAWVQGEECLRPMPKGDQGLGSEARRWARDFIAAVMWARQLSYAQDEQEAKEAATKNASQASGAPENAAILASSRDMPPPPSPSPPEVPEDKGGTVAGDAAVSGGGSIADEELETVAAVVSS